MGMYVASMFGMLVVAFITRKISTTVDGVAGVMNVRTFDFADASNGCLVLFFAITFGGAILPSSSGSLLHALQLVNPFLSLTILLGTVSAVRNSDGLRSTNLTTWFAMGYTFTLGLLYFTKQGVFVPAVCWVLGVAWSRFRLRFVHFAFLGVFIVLTLTIFVPICQLARSDVHSGDLSDRFDIVTGLAFHPSELRRREQEYEAPVDLDTRMFYFNERQGLFDRLTMMPNDSVLVQFTDLGHTFGYLPIRFYFENWVPHIIDPHKLEGIQVGGNAYAHELGGLADNDFTTGISFSPSAEAFHVDSWTGILVVAPLVWLLLFVTVDATVGDIRRQPLGMFALLGFAHIAPEAGLGGSIESVRLLNISIMVGVFACGYLAPVLGMLIRGRPVFRDDRPLFRPDRSLLAEEALKTS